MQHLLTLFYWIGNPEIRNKNSEPQMPYSLHSSAFKFCCAQLEARNLHYFTFMFNFLFDLALLKDKTKQKQKQKQNKTERATDFSIVPFRPGILQSRSLL